MCKKSTIFIFLLYLLIGECSLAYCIELKSEKRRFSVHYHENKHKFLAQNLFHTLEAKIPDWNKQLNLSPLSPIQIILCKSEADINAQKLPFDAYFIPNNEDKIFLLIENSKPIDSVQNWFQLLFYQWSQCLFRQHKIPHHLLFESSYLLWFTHDYIGWGTSSVPFNTQAQTPFLTLKNDIANMENWYSPQLISENQLKTDVEAIKNFYLLLTIYQNERKSVRELFHKRIMIGLKNNEPWQKQIAPKRWNSQYFRKLTNKRNLYAHHLQNFNYPRDNLTWGKDAESILREIIRIHKKSPILATKIFNHLALYPSNSNMFCELGIYLNTKEKDLTQHLLWLEFYLINQQNSKISTDTHHEYFENLRLSFPEKEADNDKIKLLQFMTYFAMKAELREYLDNFSISSTTNTLLLNHYFAIEILLETNNIKPKIKEKFKYTTDLLWPTIKDLL